MTLLAHTPKDTASRRHLPGNPSHSSLIGVDPFFSPIFSYFCLLVAALRPCHGSPPRRKYMKTWPRASRSSRRDCSDTIKGVSIVRRINEASMKTRRTAAQVRVDTHISCCTAKAFPFTIWYVLFCPGISILFCHPKIDNCIAHSVSSRGSTP